MILHCIFRLIKEMLFLPRLLMGGVSGKLKLINVFLTLVLSIIKLSTIVYYIGTIELS